MQSETTVKKRARRVTTTDVKRRMTRSEKLYFTFELKKKVVDSLARCGFDVKDGYLPYAKQFELIFTALEPNLLARRKRLRRIISGTPRMDDAYWVEVLERYSKEVRDISMHYCSVNFKAKKLK